MENDHSGDGVVVPHEILALREADHLRHTIRAFGFVLAGVNYLCLAILSGLLFLGYIKGGTVPDLLLLVFCFFTLVAARLHAFLYHE